MSLELARGDRVWLRSATVDDRPFVDLLDLPSSIYCMVDWPRLPARVPVAPSAPPTGADGGEAVVARCGDDRPVGLVHWESRYYGPKGAPGNRVWALARQISSESCGQGYGGEAMRLLVDWLFRTTDVNRVEAVRTVAAGDPPDLVGFRCEGVLCGARYRVGKYHDLGVYALLREEWVGRSAWRPPGAATTPGGKGAGH
jgi:hypothetical protein